MTKITLRHVQRFRDRHGKVRHYFRKPGCQRVTLPGEPGSEEFMAAYQSAMATVRTAGEGKTVPGTIGSLIVAYYQSGEWKQLTPLTHKTYRNMLDRFRERVGKSGVKYGDLPARGVQQRHVYSLLDSMSDTPGAARNLIKRLRSVWSFGMRRDLVSVNPFDGIQLPKEGKGFTPWTDAHIEQFEARWPVGSRERLALALLLYTVQRRSDVVRMGRQHRKGDTLRFTQVKGGHVVELIIPLHPDLKAILDAQPITDMTYLMTSFGKPFSAAGFTSWFVEAARASGLPAGLTPHGLRKAGSRRLAEANCTPHEIAAMTGHRSLKEIERYTKSASQEKLAKSAMDKLDGQ